ncbi:hypothetical protein HYU12_00995 [Candidatus Woesearchaeota archaeon]|nr:hypothetical protein [Candidatus Woesearchaeota archaeon]
MNRCDEFILRIQQPKMKELWDNKPDEVWERQLSAEKKRLLVSGLVKRLQAF